MCFECFRIGVQTFEVSALRQSFEQPLFLKAGLQALQHLRAGQLRRIVAVGSIHLSIFERDYLITGGVLDALEVIGGRACSRANNDFNALEVIFIPDRHAADVKPAFDQALLNDLFR